MNTVSHDPAVPPATVPEPPNDDLQERRSVDERREQLIDAAIRVLAAEGLTRATTRRITDEAGLALGAFHYAFRSKDELLAAVTERIGDRIRAAVRDGAGATTSDLGSTATETLHRLWRFVDEAPDLHLALYELTISALREPQLRGITEREYQRTVDAVVDLLRDVRDVPPGVDVADLARYLVGTVDGLVLQSLIEQDIEAARRRLELHERALEALSA